MEQRYFIRSDKIAALLHAKFAGLPEDYEEHTTFKMFSLSAIPSARILSSNNFILLLL